MTQNPPLTGLDLIDCAKANVTQGIEEAARLCGYGSDLNTFRSALTKAGNDMGIKLDGLEDLITDQLMVRRTQGLEIAPDSLQNL